MIVAEVVAGKGRVITVAAAWCFFPASVVAFWDIWRERGLYTDAVVY